jgi:molybdenum cofactor cytidylyltransferase
MIATIGDNLPALRIVVFAAGLSARLGQPKPLARVRGVRLLQRTCRLLEPFAGSSRLIVVVPPRAARYRTGLDVRKIDFVTNRRRESGLSSSVHLGIKRARCSAAVLLLPVDLVDLSAADVARLMLRWRGARRKVVARGVRDHPATSGTPGTPLILPRALYGAALAVRGDQGLRDLVRSLPADHVRLVPLPSAALDVDTPQDLARARRRTPCIRAHL